MITKDELKGYAKLRQLNLGQAEKDYFQTVLLFIIYQNYGNEIIFKGGTALSKCFGLDRFSEDLDFTFAGKMNIAKIESDLKRFKIEYELEVKKYPNGLKLTFKINGPLYIGVRYSLCKFILDISFREPVVLKPIIKTIGRHLEEIPAFDVFVMQEKEILAEKVRAIMTRNKARDVYDLWYLLNKNIESDISLMNEKLKYYNKTWTIKEFEADVKEKEAIWNTELKPLIKKVPEFKDVKKFILDRIKTFT